MKFLTHLLTLATAIMLIGCAESQNNSATVSEPLTDYSAIAPATAPIVDGEYVCQRPAAEERLFTSIERVKSLLTNPRLAWMFSNCFPNTLDTTVHYRKDENGENDTFVYTGDIHAMWLRDSAAQVWPYVQYANDDAELSSSASTSTPTPTHSTTARRAASGSEITPI